MTNERLRIGRRALFLSILVAGMASGVSASAPRTGVGVVPATQAEPKSEVEPESDVDVDVVADAVALAAEGRVVEACDLLSAAEGVEAELALANVYRDLGAMHRALPLFERVLERAKTVDGDLDVDLDGPGRIDVLRRARYGVGLCLIDLFRFDEASSRFEAASREDPDDPAAPYVLGWTRMRQGRSEEAVLAFEESVRRGFEGARGDLDFARESVDLGRHAGRVNLVVILVAAVAVCGAAGAIAFVSRSGSREGDE